MQAWDIVIVGGGPAGMVAAATSRQFFPDKSVAVIKRDEHSLVPCGIPYMFGTRLHSFEANMVPCGTRAKEMDITLLIDTVDAVDPVAKQLRCSSGETYVYTKLILATGSVPKRPTAIKHHDAPGVFYISKQPGEIRRTLGHLELCRSIVVIGTGFIGVETAGELALKGKQVHLVGSRLLKHAFDPEFSDEMETLMLHENVTFHKGRRARRITLDARGNVSEVVLDDDSMLSCDAVIMATGYQPETALARAAGLSMRRDNTIYVDEYMRTSAEDIFAVGDCAEKRHFLTKRTVPIMLASTATAEARVAAANLFKINVVKSFSGTIDIFSTVVGEHCFASAGITEEDAVKQSIAVAAATVVSTDKHPSALPNCHKQSIKLVAMQSSGIVIGAQFIGGVDSGEMINILGVIIEKRMSVFDLLNLQVATHPLLTSAPTSYPIIQAAQILAIRHIAC